VPIVFEEVIETFERVMNTTTEFMGTTVLNITTTGESLIADTFNGNSAFDLLWPDGGVPFDAEPTAGSVQDQVIVQVEYDYTKNEEGMHARGPSKLVSYFITFLCLAIIGLVVISVALCICSQMAEKTPVLKVVDETQQLDCDSTQSIKI